MTTEFPPATIRLAYLSVGEADTRRPYWASISGASFLVEPNPNWPGVRVDVRDPHWQDVLLPLAQNDCDFILEVPGYENHGPDRQNLDTLRKLLSGEPVDVSQPALFA